MEFALLCEVCSQLLQEKQICVPGGQTPSWAVFILFGNFLSDRESSPQRCAFSKEGLFVGCLNLHMTLNLTYQLIKTEVIFGL